MKKIEMVVAVIAICLAVSSCKVSHLVPASLPATLPFVQTKTGETIYGDRVERIRGFGNDRITLDDTVFRTKDVALYSYGGATYANLARKTFAVQVGIGKISLYKVIAEGTVIDGQGYHHDVTSTSYFIQKRRNWPLMKLKYRNLAPLIEPGTPEYEALTKFRRHYVANRTASFTSLGLVVGGTALILLGEPTWGSIGIMFGVVGLFRAGAIQPMQRYKLAEVVWIADKMLEKTEKRQRRRKRS